MTETSQLYDEDVVAWAEQQARALREAARSNSNLPLDWANLAEEIEDLAKAYRSSLRSQIRRVIQHLIKLQYSPALDPRRGWRQTVLQARLEMHDLLEESPSLRREVGGLIEKVMPGAIALAIADLEQYGETDALKARVIRRRSYTAGQIIGDWFPPEPPRE